MNVKKQNMTSRVLDEQEALRIYNREEVMGFATSVDDQASLDQKYLAAHDPCLLPFAGKVTITSHDELFSQNSVEGLSYHERCEALNEMHAKAARVQDSHDDEGQLVAPATLFFESTRNDKVFTHTVDFSNAGTMLVTLSPTTLVDGDDPAIHQIHARYVPNLADAFAGTEEWDEEHDSFVKGWKHVADFGATRKESRVALDPLLDEGYYVFRSRLVTAEGDIGPWSSMSAPVYVV